MLLRNIEKHPISWSVSINKEIHGYIISILHIGYKINHSQKHSLTRQSDMYKQAYFVYFSHTCSSHASGTHAVTKEHIIFNC